jgi:hypothetical protein
LWCWNVRLDCWEFVAQAKAAQCKIILCGHKRRSPKGTRFKWADYDAPRPKKFRTRSK